jgi:integrase
MDQPSVWTTPAMPTDPSPDRTPRARGSIIPRGESKWLVRVFTGRDPRTGKRQYSATTVLGTRGQAQKELTRKLAEIDAGTFRAPAKQSLGEYLQGVWLPDRAADMKAGTLSPRAFEDYSRAVGKLVALYGGVSLGTLGKAHVAELRTLLVQQYRPCAAQRTFDVFRMAVRRAYELDLIPTNPATAVRRVQTAKPKTSVLDVEQVGRFLTEADRYLGGHYSALLNILLLGGLRPAEAIALRWDDLNGSAVRVERAVTKDANGRWVVGATKTKESRSVILPARALAALTAHRQQQRAGLLQQGTRDAWEHSGRLMFPNVNGDLLTVERARKVWRSVLRRAGLPALRLYDARHSYVSALLHQGVDARTVADLAGHKDPAMTLRRYAHSLPSSRQGAADKLELALSGASRVSQAVQG